MGFGTLCTAAWSRDSRIMARLGEAPGPLGSDLLPRHCHSVLLSRSTFFTAHFYARHCHLEPLLLIFIAARCHLVPTTLCHSYIYCHLWHSFYYYLKTLHPGILCQISFVNVYPKISINSSIHQSQNRHLPELYTGPLFCVYITILL